MELRRLLNRKVVLTGILIFILQALIFFVTNFESDNLASQYQKSREYYKKIEALQGVSMEEGISNVEALLEIEHTPVVRQLENKLSYLFHYEENVQTVLKNAKSITEFSIFQEESSFSMENARKTARDFQRVEGLELALDRDLTTEHLLGYSVLPYLAFAFMIYVIYELLREQNSGMWWVTHALKKGRWMLAMRRGMSLSLIAFLFYWLCYIADLCISCAVYGMDDFGGALQTIEAYSQYTYPISKGKYVLLYGLKNSVALIVLTIISYLLFTALRSRNMAAVTLLAVLVCEAGLLKNIEVFSKWKLFRYINIMQLFQVGNLDREYHNINVAGIAVSSSLLLFCVEILMLAGCLGLTIWMYDRQYPGHSTWFEGIAIKFQRVGQKVVEKLPFELKELYKVLVIKKGILSALLCVMLCVWISYKTDVTFPEEQQEMDRTYLTYGGETWEAFDLYVEELETQREADLQSAALIQKQMREGLLGAEKVHEISLLQSRAASILIYLEEYHQRQMARDAIREEMEIEIYAMSSRGYNEVLGPNSWVRECVIGVCMTLLCVLFSANVWDMEKQSKMLPLLRGSTKGIRWIWKRKLWVIFFVTGMVFIGFYGVNLYGLFGKYSTPYRSAPLQSLAFGATERFPISIGQFLGLHTIFRVVYLISAVAVTMFLSSCERVPHQMYVPLVIIAYSIGFVMAVIANSVLLFSVLLVVFSLLTILCVIKTYRNWCL